MKQQHIYISPEGITKIASAHDQKDNSKNFHWTTDYTLELPIILDKSGQGALQPMSLVELWESKLPTVSKLSALQVKRNNKWISWTYEQYFEDAQKFGKAMLHLGLTEQSSINILGFNAPEWMIAFYGSIFGNYLPVGIYTTNLPEACFYISDHSEAECVVLENKEQLKKYLQIWDRLPKLKTIVVYNDDNFESMVPVARKNQVLHWKDVMQMGAKFKAKNEENSLENRMKRQKPGRCCTLVYTSGTTGPPKGVMLSHDNYIYTAKTIIAGRDIGNKLVSFLPLSHVVGQLIDIVISLNHGMTVYFARPDALQGSLVETLQEVRPTIFFSVPRIWEKMEEKMRIVMGQAGFPKKQLTEWAQGIGAQGTFAESHGKSGPLCFGLAKKIVYQKVKQNLGLDQVKWFIYGAAPMQPSVREFFLSLNVFLVNGFGMSETSGGFTLSFPEDFEAFDAHFLKCTGKPMPGTELLIFNPDKEGNGEICLRGRNVFMGYFKNEQATRETIDENRFLHTGDLGKTDKNGCLMITGRLKELIVTAGGENVAPVLIENEILKALPIVSNAMVIGDYKKYLSCILTLKQAIGKDGKPIDRLSDEVIAYLSSKGSKATSTAEARTDKIVIDLIQKGVEEANKQAVSKASYVRKWSLVDGDFSQDGGELTPTLKLKRKPTAQKYETIIDSMYQDSKL